MADYAKSLEGDTLEAFEIAARQIAQEEGVSEEDAMRAMRKLIYLLITRT